MACRVWRLGHLHLDNYLRLSASRDGVQLDARALTRRAEQPSHETKLDVARASCFCADRFAADLAREARLHILLLHTREVDRVGGAGLAAKGLAAAARRAHAAVDVDFDKSVAVCPVLCERLPPLLELCSEDVGVQDPVGRAHRRGVVIRDPRLVFLPAPLGELLAARERDEPLHLLTLLLQQLAQLKHFVQLLTLSHAHAYLQLLMQ